MCTLRSFYYLAQQLNEILKNIKLVVKFPHFVEIRSTIKLYQDRLEGYPFEKHSKAIDFNFIFL